MAEKKLSVVIITFNEEKNIGRCLQSIQGVADEIVIIDSGSTDKTIEIARDYSPRIIYQSWLGYSNQKNLGNKLASFDMILSLDADEALTDELRKNIISEKNKGFQGVYGFNRLTNYCGKFIRFGGWYPDFKVRLFDRRLVSWRGNIHEKLIGFAEKDLTKLKGDCLHYTYYSKSEHLRQADKFSTLSAEDLFNKGKKFSFVKYLFSPIFKFISGYIFKLGFLDGKAGLDIAWISAKAAKKKYQKLKALLKI